MKKKPKISPVRRKYIQHRAIYHSLLQYSEVCVHGLVGTREIEPLVPSTFLVCDNSDLAGRV